MFLRLELAHHGILSFLERWKPYLPILEHGLGVVRALDVGPEEAGERYYLAAGAELGGPPIGRTTLESNLHALAAGVGHLRRDGPLPNEVVKTQLVGIQLACDLLRPTETVTRRTDGLVCFLRVLNLALVLTRLVRHVLAPVQFLRLRPRRVDAAADSVVLSVLI